MISLRGALGICLAALLAGCASGPPKPVFYPNTHLQNVGQAQADRDIAECKQLAHTSGVAEKKRGEVGKKAATGAAVGGASAGAWGLVSGNAGQRALAGAAAGAAAGTVRGGVQKTETSPVFRNFVNRCLKERGYEVIGWQ
ncbi:MAG: hypothetical protein PVJ83_04155 [Gammaproteobacteria bacterium]